MTHLSARILTALHGCFSDDVGRFWSPYSERAACVPTCQSGRIGPSSWHPQLWDPSSWWVTLDWCAVVWQCHSIRHTSCSEARKGAVAKRTSRHWSWAESSLQGRGFTQLPSLGVHVKLTSEWRHSFLDAPTAYQQQQIETNWSKGTTHIIDVDVQDRKVVATTLKRPPESAFHDHALKSAIGTFFWRYHDRFRRDVTLKRVLVEQDCGVTPGDHVEPVMESRVVGNTSTHLKESITSRRSVTLVHPTTDIHKLPFEIQPFKLGRCTNARERPTSAVLVYSPVNTNQLAPWKPAPSTWLLSEQWWSPDTWKHLWAKRIHGGGAGAGCRAWPSTQTRVIMTKVNCKQVYVF